MNNISVLMPTFNRASVIIRSINSVLEQTYSDFELIVIDDGSADETEQVVSKISDERIKYIKLSENYGCSFARNVGIDYSRGKYIAFLDSDNLWTRDHLSNRLELIGKMSSKSIVFGSMYIDASNKEQLFPGVLPKSLDDRNQLIQLMLLSNRIDTNTVVMSRECIEKIGKFDVNMTALEDWDYFFRCIRDLTVEVAFDERATVYHILSPDSLSGKRKLYLSNRLVIYEKNESLIDFYSGKNAPDSDMEFISSFSSTEWNEILKDIDDEKKAVLNRYLGWTIKKQNAAWHQTFMDWMIACDNWKMWEAVFEAGKWLYEAGIVNIAIYGYGKYGKALLKSLKDSDICVKAIIDQCPEKIENKNILITSNIYDVSEVDAIIVAIMNNSEKLIKKLTSQMQVPVYWLRDISRLRRNES